MEGRQQTRPSTSIGFSRFVGRKRELALLQQALKRATSGAGSLVLVVGESGIGKTRLLQQFEARARRQSVNVVWGSCHADSDVPPFWPWQQIIGQHAKSRGDEALMRELGGSAPDLVPLVQGLAQRFPGVTRPVGDPPEARARVFDAFTDFLRATTTDAPLLAIVDDVQWIDDASLALLEHISGQCRSDPIVFVGCFRSTGLDESPRFKRLLEHESVIALNGLDRTEVAELATSIAGRPASSKLSVFLREATQGNPLFVEHMVRFIESHDAWTGQPETLGYPQAMRDAVKVRLAPLPGRTNELLRLASIIGAQFSTDVLANVANASVQEVRDALQEAISAKFLREIAGSPRDLSFAHSMIREVLYDDIPVSRRAESHHAVAHALLTLRESDVDELIASIAHHFFESARTCDPLPAAEYCARAGDQAMRGLAYEEAVNQYRRALAALSMRGDEPERRCDLLIRLGKAEQRANDPSQAGATFERALALATNGSNAALFALAALGLAGEWNTRPGVPDPEVLRILSEATERVRGSHPGLQARLLARCVHEQWVILPRARCASILDEALALAEQSRDPSAIAHVLHIRHLALWAHVDLAMLEGRKAMSRRLRERRVSKTETDCL